MRYVIMIFSTPDKSEADCDRERALIDQWVSLTEERNAVFVPAAGSNIPGAPADWYACVVEERVNHVLKTSCSFAMGI